MVRLAVEIGKQRQCSLPGVTFALMKNMTTPMRSPPFFTLGPKTGAVKPPRDLHNGRLSSQWEEGLWWPSKIYGLKKKVSSEFMGSVVFIGAYAGIYKCRFSTLPWKRGRSSTRRSGGSASKCDHYRVDWKKRCFDCKPNIDEQSRWPWLQYSNHRAAFGRLRKT